MRHILIFTPFLCVTISVFAQSPVLDRRITLSLHNEALDISLKKISQAAGFTFSYNPAILTNSKAASHNFVDKSVREVLDEIFKGTIDYKVRGNYIILTRRDRGAAQKEPAVVTGYVVDEATGERLRDVSIYDPITLASTVTDADGYFKIKIDDPSPDVILSVNRRNYTDTVVMVAASHERMLIPIRIDKEKVAVLADSVGEKVKRFWKKQALLFKNVNLENIDDTIYRASQVSFLPFAGTNHKMSGHVINDYSFNILGGYSLGVEKLEVGGLFNLVRGNMSGVQFSGLVNGVGGEMRGAQFAGVFNGNRYGTRGAQFAGVLNLNTDKTQGVQFAGVSNITTALQTGPQVSGVFNISASDTEPFQLAGVFNLSAKEMKGAQVGGVFNFTGGNMRGTQLAGVFNFAGKELRGTQLAGILNVASSVKGAQIGLINMADSIRGIPIGLISFVWKGYHKIEIAADEIFYTNLSFRTGVRQFYNILTAGAKPSTYGERETVWTFGYGVGTAPRLSRKLFLNFDLTANQIIQGNSIEAVNLLNKFYVGFDYQVLKKMSLTFGATLNGYVTENSADNNPPLFTDYQPDVFYSRALGSNHNMNMWVGGKVGLRFL